MSDIDQHPVQKIVLDKLFANTHQATTLLFNSQAIGARYKFNVKEYEVLSDIFSSNSRCHFVRVYGNQNFKINLSEQSIFRVEKTLCGGILLIPENSNNSIYWIPQRAYLRRIDAQNRILSEECIEPTTWSIGTANSEALFSIPTGHVLDIVIWQFDEISELLFEDFHRTMPPETQSIFLWGSHAKIETLADVYRHVIHGSVFDFRWAWPHKRKGYSENEAHALYTTFTGLEKITGKQIYRLLQQQLVLSTISRQATDGGWYHGTWTDNSECHYRLHTSGVHMLLDEFQRTNCPQVQLALQKAVAFLSKTTDQLNCGVWFLHDSLELSEKAMNSGPFKWIAKKTLGKKVSNMLVLNTHLDTTIAINRYSRITGDNQYQDLITSALNSTREVLGLKTADWLYKPLFWAIGLTMLPTEKARRLPLFVRAIKRFAAEYLIKKLPDIKAYFPRLVMPIGYIDRELSLRTWAIDYQTINLMDLARHAYSFPQAFDESILDKAMEFTQTSGLIQRYREMSPDKRYSVGFWCEALYYRCLTKSDIKYRQWLAEAMLECHDLSFGMAPSLFGYNGEAVLPAQQYTPPIPDNKEILFANLSKSDSTELILVNSSVETITLLWQKPIKPTLRWFNSAGEMLVYSNLTIKPRDWIRGVDNA